MMDQLRYQFRPATADDFPAICQLIQSEEELFRIYPAGRFPLTVEQLDELSRLRTALTVAVEQEQVVGFANLYDHQPQQSAFIGNVIVAPHRRGDGLGRALVQHMVAIAFERLDLPEVRISVFGNNTPALLLYAALGFSPYEIEPRSSPTGERLALLHMRHRRCA